jgi:hypothetical protein
LICQISAKPEIGVSSSHGQLVDDGRSHGSSAETSGSSREHHLLPDFGRGMKICPLCRQWFMDLFVHFNQRHPGLKLTKRGKVVPKK